MRLENGEVLLRWPLAAPIVVTAGWTYNDGKAHGATDLRAVVGTPVYAAEDGTVDQTQVWSGGKAGMQSYGNMVRVKHADYKGGTLQTRYAHLSKLAVNVGDRVSEGQMIGYSGQTGYCFGAHLHFEVIWRGVRCNPLCWLDDAFAAKDAAVKAHLWGNSAEHSVVRPMDKPIGETISDSAPAKDTRLQRCKITPGSREAALEQAGKAYDLGLPQEYTASAGDAATLWATARAAGSEYVSEYIEGGGA